MLKTYIGLFFAQLSDERCAEPVSPKLFIFLLDLGDCEYGSDTEILVLC